MFKYSVLTILHKITLIPSNHVLIYFGYSVQVLNIQEY